MFNELSKTDSFSPQKHIPPNICKKKKKMYKSCRFIIAVRIYDVSKKYEFIFVLHRSFVSALGFQTTYDKHTYISQ